MSLTAARFATLTPELGARALLRLPSVSIPLIAVSAAGTCLIDKTCRTTVGHTLAIANALAPANVVNAVLSATTAGPASRERGADRSEPVAIEDPRKDREESHCRELLTAEDWHAGHSNDVVNTNRKLSEPNAQVKALKGDRYMAAAVCYWLESSKGTSLAGVGGHGYTLQDKFAVIYYVSPSELPPDISSNLNLKPGTYALKVCADLASTRGHEAMMQWSSRNAIEEDRAASPGKEFMDIPILYRWDEDIRLSSTARDRLKDDLHVAYGKKDSAGVLFADFNTTESSKVQADYLLMEPVYLEPFHKIVGTPNAENARVAWRLTRAELRRRIAQGMASPNEGMDLFADKMRGDAVARTWPAVLQARETAERAHRLGVSFTPEQEMRGEWIRRKKILWNNTNEALLRRGIELQEDSETQGIFGSSTLKGGFFLIDFGNARETSPTKSE